MLPIFIAVIYCISTGLLFAGCVRFSHKNILNHPLWYETLIRCNFPSRSENCYPLWQYSHAFEWDISRFSNVTKNHSIANSSLFPTSLYLHSNSTQILALKKWFFWKKKSSPPQKNFFFTFFLCNFSVRTLWCFQKKNFFQKKKNFFFTFFLCNFSVRTLQCFQKIFFLIFWPQKVEKTSLKSCS